MSIYIAHRRKNASNALNMPCTDRKDTSSVYDENSQFACLAHANCFGTSSMSLVQRQRRCDGRTYRAKTVEQRVDGGWRNEDAVVQQLERPVYTAQTDNPVLGHASTCTPSPQACMWLDQRPTDARFDTSRSLARPIKSFNIRHNSVQVSICTHYAALRSHKTTDVLTRQENVSSMMPMRSRLVKPSVITVPA